MLKEIGRTYFFITFKSIWYIHSVRFATEDDVVSEDVREVEEG